MTMEQVQSGDIFLDVEAKLCTSNIETFDRRIKRYIDIFLLNSFERSFLHLKTSETKPVCVLVLQALRQLQETHSNKEYVEPGNWMFVDWRHLSMYLTQEKKFPTWINLLICEVTRIEHFLEQDGALKKLIELLLEDELKKCILIAPESDYLSKCMQKVKIFHTIVVSELDPELDETLSETPLGLYNSLSSLVLLLHSHTRIKNLSKNMKSGRPKRKRSTRAAAWEGHADAILRLCNQGTDLRMRNRRNDTLLHVATQKGHEDIIKILLIHGIDINDQGALQRTALHWAAEKGNQSLISLLLSYKAETFVKDKWNDTPLHLAARNGHSGATMTLLEHNSASINVKAKNKLTALHLAARNGYSKVVATLLKHKANVNIRDSENNTALHYSALNGHKTIVEQLIEKGASMNIKNNKGNTPLHEAVSGNHIEVTLAILRMSKVGINDKGELERTALHMTAEKGYQELVQILLVKGAEKNSTDKDKLTPLHLAIKNCHEEVSLILISSGIDVDATDIKKQTALHMAAEKGSVSVIERLLDHGANIESRDRSSWTALHFACFHGREEVVDTLIRRGADVNSNADGNYSPLHYAVYSGHFNIVKLLVNNGARVNEQNNSFQTAMDLAQSAHTQNEEIVDFLTIKSCV